MKLKELVKDSVFLLFVLYLMMVTGSVVMAFRYPP
jgi:hypothetical protein